MSAEATSTRAEAAAETADVHADETSATAGFAGWLQERGRIVRGLVGGTLFVAYMALAVVSFWMWLGAALFNGVRAFSSAGARALLVLSTGIPRLPGDEDSGTIEAVGNYFSAGGDDREQIYERWGDAMQRRLFKVRRAFLLFVTWPFGRKLIAVAMILLLVGAPMFFIVPRPQYVIITDSNSLVENVVGNAVYLIHGRGLFDNQNYEYQNRELWLYGKWSNQVVKNQLHDGRIYKLWVIGIRWYAPELYPNIVWVQEVNLQGEVIPFSPPLMLPPGTINSQ